MRRGAWPPSARTRTPPRPSGASACATRGRWRSGCRDLVDLLGRIGNANAKGEYYLTDALALAAADGLDRRARQLRGRGGAGRQLAGAAGRGRGRVPAARARPRHGGRRHPDGARRRCGSATIPRWGAMCSIEPNVFFGPGVVVEDGAHIMANCHIVGARIRAGARVGPFARLRPGADIGADGAHRQFRRGQERARWRRAPRPITWPISATAAWAKGPTSAPAPSSATTTASTSTSPTWAEGAFVGSNTSLVAPVKIGDGAYIGSGSVITRDVEADALAAGAVGAGDPPRLGRQVPALKQKPKDGREAGCAASPGKTKKQTVNCRNRELGRNTSRNAALETNRGGRLQCVESLAFWARTRWRRISSTPCAAWNTGATTRPASPRSRTAASTGAAPRASSRTWS